MAVRRERLIQFRVSEDEKARIGELAERAGLPVSEFVRGRALEQASGIHPGRVDGQSNLSAGETVNTSPAPARASAQAVPGAEVALPGRRVGGSAVVETAPLTGEEARFVPEWKRRLPVGRGPSGPIPKGGAK